MGMAQRTVHEMHCDVAACTSVVTGPTHQTVVDTAFGQGGWRLVPIQRGHGVTEVIHQCDRHHVETIT